MSRIVIYSIVAIVPDDCLDFYPVAIDTKHEYIQDLVCYTAEEVDQDWLKNLQEKND